MVLLSNYLIITHIVNVYPVNILFLFCHRGIQCCYTDLLKRKIVNQYLYITRILKTVVKSCLGYHVCLAEFYFFNSYFPATIGLSTLNAIVTSMSWLVWNWWSYVSNHVKEVCSQVPRVRRSNFPVHWLWTLTLQPIHLKSQLYSVPQEEVWPDSNLQL